MDFLPVVGDPPKNTCDTEEDQRHSESEDDSFSEDSSDTDSDEGCSVGEEMNGLSSSLGGKETELNSAQGESETHPEELKETHNTVPRRTLRDAVNESAGAE